MDPISNMSIFCTTPCATLWGVGSLGQLWRVGARREKGSARNSGEDGTPGITAKGRLHCLTFGHSAASPATTSGIPPLSLRSLTVVPLQTLQRYYGETTVRRRGDRGETGARKVVGHNPQGCGAGARPGCRPEDRRRSPEFREEPAGCR